MAYLSAAQCGVLASLTWDAERHACIPIRMLGEIEDDIDVLTAEEMRILVQRARMGEKRRVTG